jgi:CelD/BcsL family acetyltransferase involved in cellulose biosynthesis
VNRATLSTAFRTTGAPAQARPSAAAHRSNPAREFPSDLSLHIYDDLNAVEDEWRSFEREADCTAFQTFDWLATWQRRIGQLGGVTPVVAVGRFVDGKTAFIAPLAIASKHSAKRLCWLGQPLSDYNAPLLARDFSQRVAPDLFLAIWQEVRDRLRSDPRLHYDWIEFEQMPPCIGAQVNPFTYLGVADNPSGAHLMRLDDTWQKFYLAKRSSATRRRDRAKWRHMSQYGEIRFVTSPDADDARRTLEHLMDQKKRSLAERGVADIFARPGYREFYLDLASNPAIRDLVFVSRIDIGADCAAANFGLIHGGRYYHVLASFERDIEASRYGPGVLHLRKIMEHATGIGLREFDFTIGDEPYKREWTDTDLKLYDYTAAATWRGWMWCCYVNALRPLKRFIKQTPLAWRLATDVRAVLGRYRHGYAAGPDFHRAADDQD